MHVYDNDNFNSDDTGSRVSALLHSKTAELDPDVSSLVRGAIDRSRSRQRRTTIATAFLAAVAVGAVGVGVGVVPDLGGDGASDPAAPLATTTPAVPSQPLRTPPLDKATMKPPPVPVADIPVRAADLPGEFVRLFPGKLAPAPESTGGIIDDGRKNQVAHFLWNGYMVTVAFNAFAGTPQQACGDDNQGAGGTGGVAPRCATRPDGTVLANGRRSATIHDGGGMSVVNSAALYTKDGYVIVALVYNWASKAGPILADNPPLTVNDVETAVISKIWF